MNAKGHLALGGGRMIWNSNSMVFLDFLNTLSRT